MGLKVFAKIGLLIFFLALALTFVMSFRIGCQSNFLMSVSLFAIMYDIVLELV